MVIRNLCVFIYDCTTFVWILNYLLIAGIVCSYFLIFFFKAESFLYHIIYIFIWVTRSSNIVILLKQVVINIPRAISYLNRKENEPGLKTSTMDPTETPEGVSTNSAFTLTSLFACKMWILMSRFIPGCNVFGANIKYELLKKDFELNMSIMSYITGLSY